MDSAVLMKVPAFAELSEQERNAVATWANEASISEGSIIVNEGEYSYTFFAILEGSADVIRHGENIAALGPGDFFGEVGLLEKEKRNATVKATGPMRLVTLTSWDLRRLEKEAPGAMEQIHRVLQQRR
ncbi:MAG: cyclic nucleotide-binding domain-containing protein [Solirubrobacteraceae bacterium]